MDIGLLLRGKHIPSKIGCVALAVCIVHCREHAELDIDRKVKVKEGHTPEGA